MRLGPGHRKLICHRLVERYRFKQENLILTSAFELGAQSYDNILCIFTTIPLAGEFSVPVVLVDLTMNGTAQTRIDDFMRTAAQPAGSSRLPQKLLLFPDMSFHNREETLNFLCARMEEAFSFLQEGEESFTAQVKRREALSSTEVGGPVDNAPPLWL